MVADHAHVTGAGVPERAVLVRHEGRQERRQPERGVLPQRGRNHLGGTLQNRENRPTGPPHRTHLATTDTGANLVHNIPLKGEEGHPIAADSRVLDRPLEAEAQVRKDPLTGRRVARTAPKTRESDSRVRKDP